MLATLAHTVGWPIPVGGSQAIPDALIADLRAHGGTITAGEEITEPPCGVVLFDTAPTALLCIYRDKVPARYAKSLQRYRFGPGVAKVDFVLSDEFRGPIHGRPRRRHCTWAAPASRWRTPNARSPRAGMPNGRWCSPPCRTWPTRAASTRRVAGRCGPMHMFRMARPSTRPKP